MLQCLIIILLLTGCRDNTGVKTDKNAIGKCYYVSLSGNDQNIGSITKPWKTLGKINTTDLNPGDTILLEGGALFTGTIFLDSLDSGEESKKVVIGSYGNGRAIIDGANSEGIIVKNCSHFIIRDLIVKGSGRVDAFWS